jgi:hypothetical protein
LRRGASLDKFTIESDGNIVIVKILDLSGKMVLESKTQSTLHTLDVSTLKSGMYILNLKNGKKQCC